jgi:amino acid adenylation domain-containing protein
VLNGLAAATSTQSFHDVADQLSRPMLLSDLFDSARLEAGAHAELGSVDPDAVALTDSDVELTWTGAIDRIARLAAVLVEAGVQAGDRVGVRLPKSVDSFVAVHAVLRCGGVMVPLDPMAPPAQVAGVIDDAEIEVLVADMRARLLGEIVDATKVTTVVLPRAAPDTSLGADRKVAVLCSDVLDDAVADAPLVEVSSDDPAYIIYTSGSTGRPKGIVHTHASGLAYARAAVRQYNLNAADRFANIAPLHFDQSTFELYAAPFVGATVLAVPDPVIRFPASLSDLISKERITVWYSVPYVLEQLSTRGGLADRDLSPLRWVLYGGESFPPAQLAALMTYLPDATFSNVYGPAEVNQCTVFDLVDPPTGQVPIGSAWDEAELRVVDPDDLSSEVEDRPGVLLVSTPTMMSHYWRRPDLTEAAIIEADGRRWYHTGDLVEFAAPGGPLVFLGRLDNQIKLRGHRIELEAIDALLIDVDNVEVATTVVRRKPNGDDVLVALVVPESTSDGLPAQVLNELSRRLPRYAVPAEVLIVSSLPRTGTGKIDRGASAELLDQTIASSPVSQTLRERIG